MDRRSQKDGSRVQVVLKCRDKGTDSSPLLQSGDRAESLLEQEVKAVAPPIVKRL